ncbi:hypothetical protein GpartN1_g1471.t1 [Galdieria partita]|uniref:Uncharacterized protein n=1 Tax=Galdieria partita TaxID=83374 RepID=A0A9C7PSF2_9RHOD|nr:hypothetical protein GpartN1_g1471.t1 [Galdieria partita]
MEEELVEILSLAKNILISVDEEYESVVRQHEHLIGKQRDVEEACGSITEEIKTLSELEDRWFSNKLWLEEPFSITGTCRTKENWISSLETFEHFCKVVEESSKDSSVLIDFVKQLRAKKMKLTDEALLLYKKSGQEDTE